MWLAPILKAGDPTVLIRVVANGEFEFLVQPSTLAFCSLWGAEQGLTRYSGYAINVSDGNTPLTQKLRKLDGNPIVSNILIAKIALFAVCKDLSKWSWLFYILKL